jgi:hypothetical protein
LVEGQHIQHCLFGSSGALKLALKLGQPPTGKQCTKTIDLESEIQSHILLADISMGTFGDKVIILKGLELERNLLLLKDEATWRQRCRTTWLKCGDLNTKYFPSICQLL